MATRTGRNDPCPCGSGKKYKKCCLGGGPGSKPAPALLTHAPVPWEMFEDDIDIDSNRVVHLVEEGKLDEAERQCQLLREKYPDDIDWLERYALVYEAREDWGQAVEYYRRAADYAEARPSEFSPELIADFKTKAARLEAKAGERS